MIVPGSLNPLMLAMFGDPLDELGIVAKSVRVRRSASASMARTFVPTAGGTTGTFLFRVRRALLGTLQALFSWSNGATAWNILFNADDTLDFGSVSASAYVARKNPSRVFRDTAAYLDIQIVVDTTNATAGDRLRVYINGVRETSFLNSTDCAQNTVTNLAQNWAWAIGAQGGTNTYFSDINVAQAIWVDGVALAPTAFGLFHPRTAQWRPRTKAAIKAVVDAGGPGSFFVDGSNPTNTTTLCADQSAKGNNFTASNISLAAGSTYDSSPDSPTNVYCALNPLANGSTTLANGALEITGTTLGAIHGTMVVPRDYPVYFEVENLSANNSNLAIGAGVVRVNVAPSVSYQIGSTQGIAGFYSSNGPYVMKDNGTAQAATGGTSAAGDVLQVAINGNNGWVGRNDVWYDSAGGTTGNPATGANPSFTISSAFDYVPYVHVYANTGKANFGQRAWSKTCPAGFKALNTKNLTRPLIPKPESAFVARADSGANIVATVSAAAPFANWIRIYKRRDSAEGWRWQFSDDAANYLDSSSNGAKAAFPALGGTSYVGYSLKVSGLNGVATGRLVHVNGAADVVADGLGNSRKMILLKNEAAGTWYVYHPELTAGKLLYLEQTTAETTDATISTVTSSGFTVAAALASGTYRWIALAEVDGFLKLTKVTGNGGVDGPFENVGHDAAFSMLRRIDSTGYCYAYDRARSPVNAAKLELYLNLATSEQTNGSGGVDLTSSGTKIRFADVNLNVNGAIHIGLSIAASQFRHANAR